VVLRRERASSSLELALPCGNDSEEIGLIDGASNPPGSEVPRKVEPGVQTGALLFRLSRTAGSLLEAMPANGIVPRDVENSRGGRCGLRC
jgi:hypothetical protein